MCAHVTRPSYIHSRHEERCEQQHAGKEQPEQPEPGGMDCSGPNMGALLAAVEQVDAEPALLATAPAAAATEDSIAAAAAGAAQPAAVGSSPALAAHAAQAAQRRVEQAVRAFEEAGDTASPEAMLRPLRLLALVGHGGALLQVSWPSGCAFLLYLEDKAVFAHQQPVSSQQQQQSASVPAAAAAPATVLSRHNLLRCLTPCRICWFAGAPWGWSGSSRYLTQPWWLQGRAPGHSWRAG